MADRPTDHHGRDERRPARFSRAELEAFRGAAISDIVGDGLKLLFVGVNPGLRSAALQAPFVGGNRFYPALFAAGIIERPFDTRAGLHPADRDHLIARGVGITAFVHHATATAAQVPSEDLVAGANQLTDKVAAWNPRVVAILGTGAFHTAFGMTAAPGEQSWQLAHSALWVVPNPSGRNLHESVATLARAYREAATAAGIALSDRDNTAGE